jgi:hypothetical protein
MTSGGGEPPLAPKFSGAIRIASSFLLFVCARVTAAAGHRDARKAAPTT